MATPKFFLYGANPSELAQQQAGYEGRITNIHEGNRAAAFAAQQASLSAFLQAQQREDYNRRADQQNRMAFFQNDERRGDRLRGEAEEMRRFNLDLGMKRDDRRQAMDFNTRFGIPREQAELERIKAETAKAKREPISSSETAAMQNLRHKILSDAADNGEIRDAVHAKALAPGINDDAAEWYAARSRQAMDEINPPPPVGWNQGVSTPSFVPDAGGSSTPLVVPPPMFDQQPATTPQVPAFFSQPRTSTATTSVSGYVPGKRYGNLRYLGGDPNLQTSWTPAGN